MNERIYELHLEFANILNIVIGLLAFSLALGSLGSQQPGFNALISIIFMGFVYLSFRNYFYNKYAVLRLNADSVLRARILKVRPLGMWEEFKATPIYFVGSMSLIAVMVIDVVDFYLQKLELYPSIQVVLHGFLYGE